MTWYAVEQRYVDQDRRQQVRETHLDYLRGLTTEGKLVGGGPWGDQQGSLCVYACADQDELHALLDADPYRTEGVTEVTSIREWKAVVGTAVS